MNEIVIELFMWGYQRLMQISMEYSAKSLFSKIDYKLNPKIFFLGILVEERDGRHPICLEPESCGFTTQSFSDIKRLAAELEKVDEEKLIFNSHPVVQQNHERRITTKSYVEAVNKILKQQNNFSDNDYFVASPTYIEGYWVFTILSLDKNVLNNYYSLSKNKLDNRYRICRSFIDSTIEIYLKECSNALKEPDKGISAIERNVDELLRDAGKKFMYTVSSAGRNIDGLNGLYEACNEIASMKYEGAVSIGKMIIAPKDHKNIKISLQLKEPIKINDYRKVRKFLELSTNDTSIISDSALIYGLGEIRGKYNSKEESIFEISFTSHFTWMLIHDNNPLMVVEYRDPSLPKEKINREKFYSDFPRLFKGINKEQIDDLWDITMEATKQKHGTMLVISDIASKEAIRLGKQCFPLKPIKLTENIIQQITSIDGAVLLDRDSTCHAIGVILDGIASDKGDSARGARYNSAIRYFEYASLKSPLALVIISEDGMINLIPNLKPQIQHSLIVKAISEFKDILNAEKLDHKAFNQGMNFFQEINFYLNKNECYDVNVTRIKIEEKFKKDLEMMKVIYNDLVPNEEMNHSYYIEE